jgi:hypothetical protein
MDATLDAWSKTLDFLDTVLVEDEIVAQALPLTLESFPEQYENIDIVMVPEQIVATVTNE